MPGLAPGYDGRMLSLGELIGAFSEAPHALAGSEEPSGAPYVYLRAARNSAEFVRAPMPPIPHPPEGVR